MIRSLLMSAVLIAGMTASASTTINNLMFNVAQSTLSDVETMGLHFVQGDMANYNLDMGGFIKGSMVMTVKSVTATEAVIGQDMDLGFAGKQNCEMTLDPNTGATKKFVCNGKEQNTGDQGDIEVIDTKEDTVTVPAGTFTCLYIKAKQKSSGDNIEQWANLKQVPVFGMVKMVAPSQLGQVTIELKSFKKN